MCCPENRQGSDGATYGAFLCWEHNALNFPVETQGKGKVCRGSGQLEKSVSYCRKEEIHAARLCQEGVTVPGMDKQACRVPTRPSNKEAKCSLDASFPGKME